MHTNSISSHDLAESIRNVVTDANFGSKLQLEKFIYRRNITIAWRTQRSKENNFSQHLNQPGSREWP